MITPYEEGFRDRISGVAIWQNPYSTFTREFSQWEDGWLEQDRHLNGRDDALDDIYS